MEHLEKLDEARLLVVLGMFIEKHRHKYSHDQNVRTNRSIKGDLDLVYTLKKHKRKLMMRRLGPYVINELNTNGTVCLHTLDGETMDIHINVSHLKEYKESLIEEMLHRIHAAYRHN